MFGIEIKYALLFGSAAALGITFGFAISAMIIETISDIFFKIKNFFDEL